MSSWLRRLALLAVCGLALPFLTGGCSKDTQQKAAARPVAGRPVADNSTWQTAWGPLSAADRELIRKVRLASLWEMPAAQEASRLAQSPRVRQISLEIAAQHMTLDQQVRDLAGKLNVELPVAPTAQQKQWLNDIRGSHGHDYDVTYVKWLRLAHGQIFALVGAVRGSTQNSLVRSFSETANTFVLNHMRLLESTGLTSPSAFPAPPSVTPAPAPSPS
jgi:predicted outer membrane protein